MPIPRVILPATLLLAALSPLTAATPVGVPRGTPPLVDHRLTAGEWDDAARVDLPGGHALRLKQTAEHFYVCLQLASPAVFGMDLYLADDTGRLIDLHASSYLGERTATGGEWPTWSWWNNDGWIATIVPYEMKDGRPAFTATAGKEFQLDRRRFAAGSYRLRLVFRLPGNPPAVFPETAAEFDAADWLPLKL